MVNFKNYINGFTHMLKLSACVCELEPEDHILGDAENTLCIKGSRTALIPVGVEDRTG